MPEEIVFVGQIEEKENKYDNKLVRLRISDGAGYNWYSAFDDVGQGIEAVPLYTPVSITWFWQTSKGKQYRTIARFALAPAGTALSPAVSDPVAQPPAQPAQPPAQQAQPPAQQGIQLPPNYLTNPDLGLIDPGCAHGVPWTSRCGQCILREAVIKPVAPIVAAMIREGKISTPHEVMHCVEWLTDQFEKVVQGTYVDPISDKQQPDPPPPPVDEVEDAGAPWQAVSG